MTTISDMDDVIDSRDVIERIETLESKLEAFLEENDVLLEENFPEWEELETLRALATECSSLSADWKYGETLIRYNYWENYVKELLEDCGDIPADLPWYIAVDWETTADNISQDYSIVEFNGVEYYIRSI